MPVTFYLYYYRFFHPGDRSETKTPAWCNGEGGEIFNEDKKLPFKVELSLTFSV